jgi:hypothetical protein
MSERERLPKKPRRDETLRSHPANIPPGNADPRVGDASPDEKTFNPYKFQTNTMPRGLRADLIAAGLPRADPQRIDDTLRPNALGPPAAVTRRMRGNAPHAVRRWGVGGADVAPRRGRLLWWIGLGAALVAASLLALFAASETQPASEARKEPGAPRVPKGAPAPRVDPTRPSAEVSSAALPESRVSIDTRPPSSTRLAASARTPSTRPPAASPRVREELGAETVPSASGRANPFDKPFKPPAEY